MQQGTSHQLFHTLFIHIILKFHHNLLPLLAVDEINSSFNKFAFLQFLLAEVE